MNWGYSIALSFVLFIALIATLVTISMKQDIHLVAENYYEQEIEYQDQIERIRRTQSLVKQPEVYLDRENSSIRISLGQANVKEGQAVFFRPADATRDKVVRFPEADGKTLSVADWEKGLWKIKLTWTSGDEEFYMEQNITL